jgi:DNA-directed RNA polymerase subunit alpha
VVKQRLSGILLEGCSWATSKGTAVTAVRIAGVNHEYATIPGVREDVLDILLNCKQLTVNSRTDELEIGRLIVSGPATVKAKDLQFSSQVQVVDGERPIATVSEGHSLELEVHVERGVGYRPVDRHNEDTSAIDLLPDRCCIHACSPGEFHDG